MLDIVVFFTVLIATLLPINGTPLRDRNLDLILNLMQKQIETENTSEDSSSTSASEDNQQMRNKEVIELIQQANKLKKKQRIRSDTNTVDQNYRYHQHETNRNDISPDVLKERVIDQLLQDKQKQFKKVTHKRFTPDRLLNYNLNNDNAQEQVSGLNEYSKIYLILDPTALQNSMDSDDLPSLVSKILSQSSSAVEKTRQGRNKTNRYKGFMVKDSTARRFRLESNEMYGGGGDGATDDDYRPKRQKYDHGGGGGRTSIPYIRHRGDIYERDH